jgi:hypothetical protein
MSMEDALSAVGEQLFLEQQEKEEWLRKEAAKMAQWEKEQQLKDEIEMKKRKQKILDLEEKKRKLAELRKTQDGDVASSRQSDLLSARNEALKLSKQMRIQNKAKFVSKRRKGRETSQKDLFSGSMMLPQAEKMSPASLFSSTHAGHSDFSKAVEGDSVAKDKCLAKESPVDDESTALCDMSKFEALLSETELHCALKELMAEKRGLRLELMQKKSSAVSSEDILEVKACQLRIKQISAIETYIKGRVEKLVQKETEVVVKLEGEKEKEKEEVVADVGGGGENYPSAAVAVSKQGPDLDMTRRFSTEHSSSAIAQLQINSVYHDIETNLRETNELVLKADVVGLFGTSANVPSDELGTLARRAGLLKMKTVDFIVKISHNGDDDINGYDNKLKEALDKLQIFLENVAGQKKRKKCQQQPGASSPPVAPKSSTIASQQTAAVQESQSMPLLGNVNTMTVQTHSVSESVIMTPSSSSAILITKPAPQNKATSVKDTKWEEVKKTIAPAAQKEDVVKLVPSSKQEGSAVEFLKHEGGTSESSEQGAAVVAATEKEEDVGTASLISHSGANKFNETGEMSTGFAEAEEEDVWGEREESEKEDEAALEEAPEEEEEEVDYESIEGWNECLHTTMVRLQLQFVY